MIPFNLVWNYIQSNLKQGMKVKNWTVDKDYFGLDITIITKSYKFIEFDSSTAKTIQKVAKDEFEKIWKVWPDYKTQKIKRGEMVEFNRHTRYIIDLFHWYDEETK